MMPIHVTRLTNASKNETLALDDIRGYHGDVQGPQGITSMWEGHGPLGLGFPGCLQRKCPSFSWCKSSISSYPQHPSGLSPHESDLIIPSCVLAQLRSYYALQGFISHRDHSM
jgi:hypothetical protein